MARFCCYILMILCVATPGLLVAQVQVQVVVDSGSSTTTCTDVFGDPDPTWRVNVENQGWVFYPGTPFCPVSLPNTQYSASYNCPADVPASIQVCFGAFEDDSVLGPCNGLTISCSETVCGDFAIPALDATSGWVLQLPDGLSSDGLVSFTISTIGQTANVTGSKTVRGDFAPGGTIFYTLTLVNNGSCTQADNPGDELIDVLPPQLTVVDTTVVTGGGTVATDGPSNTVTWNGAIAPAGSVVLEIEATIDPGAAGMTISNQATIFFDGDGDGTNESTTSTEGVTTGGPTTFVVFAATAIPTLDGPALLVFGLLIAVSAFVALRRSTS